MPGPGLDLIGDKEVQEVIEVIRSGHLVRYGPEDDPSFGAKTYQLERDVEALLDVRHALAVNSGTSALLCAFAALDIGPGDEVIVPGFTYVASISAIVHSRATPVLAEIDESLNLDPSDVEARITPRTKAILAVHMMGNPARLKELSDISKRHGLALIEDCAQAFGATYHGQSVGTFGAAGVVSFNAFKTLTCGEGGMVITNDEDTYHRAFAFHDQGHAPFRKGIEVGNRPFLGLNFRMTELQSAVLLAQLARLAEIRSTLRRNKAIFKDLISDLPRISFRKLPDPDGDLATLLTVFMPTEHIARAVAKELGQRVVGESGWHVYNQMEHVLQQRLAVNRGCPFDCSSYSPDPPVFKREMLPRTDGILARAVNIAIGVRDPNLGSGFGIGILDDVETIEHRAEEFCAAALAHL